MKKLIILTTLILSFCDVISQQDAQYTQYMYNTVGINPAYAGSRGTTSILALHRSQWVGIEGAPETQTFSIHTPFSKSKIGLGLSFVNDKLGVVTEQYLNIDISYTIPVSEKGKLAFGIKGVLNMLNVDFTKLTIDDESDPYSSNIDNRFTPNFGVGLYFYTPNYYIGLSVPNILESEHYKDGSPLISNLAKERMNYYLIGGYVFQITTNMKLKPALLTKYVAGAPLQIDLSLNALFHEKFRIGLAYRWSAALSAMTGFQINENLLIGYAYDWDTTDLVSFDSGSHEVFLRVELFNTKVNLVSPRFF
ncbi:MAG: type IX secretion system membrane protein PorP/SprF [Flavobacteriaceae bacterium]|nr:type IX secretion system membrane protein PorP/SprF [Flavobacteriaceae bacterium]